MAKHGKSYNAAAEKVDRATLYTQNRVLRVRVLPGVPVIIP